MKRRIFEPEEAEDAELWEMADSPWKSSLQKVTKETKGAKWRAFQTELRAGYGRFMGGDAPAVHPYRGAEKCPCCGGAEGWRF